MPLRILRQHEKWRRLFGKYRVKITYVPLGMPRNHSCRDEFDDRSIDNIPNTKGAIWVHVYDVNGDYVGMAIFAADEDATRCEMVTVDELHRNKGIAKALYKMASRIYASPIIPSETLLDGGKQFWGNRTQITWTDCRHLACAHRLLATAWNCISWRCRQLSDQTSKE